MKRDYKALANKLERLRALDKKQEIFGSNYHNYLLNPKLSEQEVEEFEMKNGIVIPSEYRYFICEIGNGGSGPCYGLLPLTNYHEHYDNYIWEDEDLKKSYLRYSFPYTDKWEPRSNNEHDNYDVLKQSLSGTLALSHEGCGYYTLLIVSGEERGNIWLDGMVSDQGMMPLIRNGNRLGFYEWYENWLDNSILEVLKKKKNTKIFRVILNKFKRR
ncbi:hypothetical protein DFQ01_1303 [Paenibacillus cellulosilyticus]|uniref:Knr4/Smi1-like domain-containing protein n=2 Tax=Paenibacillus cellulosilyticus TaxID=375489 RepID=A0A2V2YLT1_9BACL|nr:hypothetical protein DFQ01_1303 [Paenibacillus cellulosilyticus]